MESKIFITHDIKCAVNASTAGKGDCDCGAVEQAEKQEAHKEWVGLTDEQIVKSVREIGWGQSYINWTEIIEFTRYIEAKLKEKNT